MEGYRDPFNRGCYPWGSEDQELLAWYRQLGQLRAREKGILAQGVYRTVKAEGNLLAFERFVLTGTTRDSLLLVVNRSHRPQSTWGLRFGPGGGRPPAGRALDTTNLLPPFGYSLMKIHRDLKPKQEPERVTCDRGQKPAVIFLQQPLDNPAPFDYNKKAVRQHVRQ